jgi:PhzF family phenazine biosynthesis protein
MTPVYEIHSFVAAGMQGNPAGVCLLDTPREPAWMQQVARSMGLSETAFVVPQHDGYQLRWFTPTTEMDLCGHATLAAAYVLWQLEQHSANQPIAFFTASGVLTARQQGIWIEMDLPSIPMQPIDPPPDMVAALGIAPEAAACAGSKYLFELLSETQVRAVIPDFARLRELPVRGVMVTSRAANPGYDFVSRYFAPAVGIDEDPVTGSAHCSLAPWWAKRLGKTALLAQQVSARGGVLRLRLAGGRVFMAGQTVLSGQRQMYD